MSPDVQRRLVVAILSVLVAHAARGAELPAAGLPASMRTFMESHCHDCHDADTARAGFRTDLLSADFNAGNNADQWKEVMDKINSGEMPPKKKRRPDAKEAFAVASWVAQRLDETTKAAQGAGPNAHDSKHLPLILCGGSALGLKHQGHLVQRDVPVANVWKTVVGRVGMKVPEDFQGGLANGVVKELI